MEIALFVIISYIVAVIMYTLIVRNNAMNKYNPHVKIWDIVKEGLRGMGIGYLITGLVIGIVLMLFNFFG